MDTRRKILQQKDRDFRDNKGKEEGEKRVSLTEDTTALLLHELKRLNDKVDNIDKNVQRLESIEKKFEDLEEHMRKTEQVVEENRGEIQVAKKERGQLKKNLQEIQTKTEGQEEKTRKLEIQLDEALSLVDKQEDTIALLELSSKENWLRIRGVSEEKEEDLHMVLSDLLVQNWIEKEELDTILNEITDVYRITTGLSRTNKAPRDIIIKCTHKRFRDLILERHYRERIQNKGKSVILMKEIPTRILRRRREYKEVVDLLRQSGTPFSWDRLEGVIFTYRGERFRLNSKEKADNFVRRYRKDFSQKKERKQIQGNINSTGSDQKIQKGSGDQSDQEGAAGGQEEEEQEL